MAWQDEQDALFGSPGNSTTRGQDLTKRQLAGSSLDIRDRKVLHGFDPKAIAAHYGKSRIQVPNEGLWRLIDQLEKEFDIAPAPGSREETLTSRLDRYRERERVKQAKRRARKRGDSPLDRAPGAGVDVLGHEDYEED